MRSTPAARQQAPLPPPAASVRFAPAAPIDLRATLGRAFRFPAAAWRSEALWRATRTADGPATVRLRAAGDQLEAAAWGPGAAAAIDAAPATAGTGDDRSTFRPDLHPLVEILDGLSPGMRIPRTGAVLEALVPAILEQKVQATQARRAFRGLMYRHGLPAPGPGALLGLRLLPEPSVLARIPASAFHPLNVERKRAVTIVTAARYAAELEACAGLDPKTAQERMQTLPGIGPWTAAEVAAVALGDADAVSVGDFHLPNTIAFALAREPRADDRRMLELLAPWSGDRARVVKLIETARIHAPRRGPRLALQDISGW